MRPARTLLPLVASLSLIAGCGGGDSTSTEAESTATESTTVPVGEDVVGTGYSFSAPEDWAVSETPSSSALDAEITAPGGGGFQTNINVATESLPADISIDTYTNVTIQNILDSSTGNYSATVASDPSSADVAGDEARVYDLDASFGDQPLGQRQTAVVHGDTAYVITLTAEPGDLDSYAGDLDSAISSWEWE